ncbi:MAG: carboxypeptidase-like regulatory domain-containing protein [Bacteroidetes bacterium]|nr:carboxypeptidase-like regulatory domain-containing protein [Bacteroidota bacterium]
MKKTLLFLFISLFAQSGFSQSAEKGGVRGFVYNAKTKEPIVMATVGLFGTKYGTTTDVNGFFNFTNVEAGSYKLIVRSVGFDSSAKEVVIANGKITNVTFNIAERTKMLKNIDISAKKQLSKTKVNMSTVNISPKEISKLPSIGGESDLAQYLQVVPGVVSTGDQGGQVYIRGGTPVMTKFLLDGMTVYNPFTRLVSFLRMKQKSSRTSISIQVVLRLDLEIAFLL